MADAKFRIGNLERLLTLPVPSDSVKAAPARAGAVLTALNGRRTVQTFGYTRSWEFTFNAVTLDEAAEFESLYLGNIQAPYFMFDPMRKNLLPREVSAPTSVVEGVGYTAQSTTGLNKLQTEFTAPATSPVPSATAAVRLECTASNYIRRMDPKHLGEPIIPGQTYTHSIWVNLTSGGGIPYICFRDKNGADLALWGPATTITTTGWSRWTHTQTAPAGAVYAETGIWVDSPGFVGDIGPAQLEVGSTATTWAPGYGTPAVSIETIDIDYPRYGIANVTATILEI